MKESLNDKTRNKLQFLKYFIFLHIEYLEFIKMLKNKSVYFLAICAKFTSKIEKFELEIYLIGKSPVIK